MADTPEVPRLKKAILPEVRKPKRFAESQKKALPELIPATRTRAPYPGHSLKEILERSKAEMERRRWNNLPVWRRANHPVTN